MKTKHKVYIVNNKNNTKTIFKNRRNWYFYTSILWILFFVSDACFVLHFLIKMPLEKFNIPAAIFLIMAGAIVFYYMRHLSLHFDRHTSPLLVLKNSHISILDEDGDLHKKHFDDIRSIHGQVYEQSDAEYVELSFKLTNGDKIVFDAIHNLVRRKFSKYEQAQQFKDRVMPTMKILADELDVQFFMNNSIKKN